MKCSLRLLAAGTVLLAAQALRANNVRVSNTHLKPGQGRTVQVLFDLSWENSWRDAVNHDACWLFAKYSVNGGSTWHHATLAGDGLDPAGFSVGTNANAELFIPADRKGAFIQRSAAGTGTFASTGVRLLWDRGADGVTSQQGRVKLFAVEMVYIPEGPFTVGDDSSVVSFLVTRITSANANLSAGSGAGTLAEPYTNAVEGLGRPKGITGTFAAGYPNGYGAFYCMKYEMTRIQYLDFVNALPADQAALRKPTFAGRTPNVTGTHPAFTNALPFLPFDHTTGGSDTSTSGWTHQLAYLDWAALRPMTELEFEKACRGPVPPVDRDFAWGLPTKQSVGAMTGLGSTAETPSDPDANLVDGDTLLFVGSPLRVGALATAVTDQFQAGASYYGVMELSGNVWERVIAAGPWNTRTGAPVAESLAFDGRHGDGELDVNALADVTNWPVAAAATGSGFRGGDGSDVPQRGSVADRTYGGRTYAYSYRNGMRGVRTR